MQIQRSSKTTISPRGLEELINRMSWTFYNIPRNLRQPVEIYNLSLSMLWESFEEVLDELDKALVAAEFRQNPPTAWGHSLIRRQEYLLYRMMQHFDDCRSILTCFFPQKKTKPDSDRDDILKQPVLQPTIGAIKPYRDHIANIVNHMKHNQGMLRGVVAFNDNVVVLGYFVEYVDQNEALTPHPNVHKLFNKRNTAFSFYRDLRYIFWIIYDVSEHLADAIIKISSPTPNVFSDTPVDENVISIARRIEALPRTLFEDELHADFPYVGVEETKGIVALTLEYPSSRTILPALSGNFKVLANWSGDGVTRKFAPPYFTP